MGILRDDRLTQLAFSVYENKGVYAVLLGSGLSRGAEIPTGWEITLDLIRRIASAQGVEEQRDWAQWYRDKAGKEPDYSNLLEELASSQDERRSILHSYIEPTDEDREEGRKVPTAAHAAVADLVRAGYIRAVITTNFDRLIENALRELGVEPTVVASTDALQGAEPLTHSACYVLKLHGDYKDARIRNTDAELADYPPEFDRLLDRIFDEFGLIVCGWSGEWDHALRAALLRTPNRRYPLFWCSRGQVSDRAQELIDHRHGRVIRINDADSFFSALSERVNTLADTHRPNPRTVELLVNSTKRYVAKPEYRIQLDGLFTEEVERLISHLDAAEFRPDVPFDVEDFRKRVARYEAISEPLARMAGTLGRWGEGSDLPFILDILQSIVTNAEKRAGGLVVYVNLRTYPAVLIFSAYGLGLTRSCRWQQLHDLFSAEIAREEKESRRVVEKLALFAWEGADNKLWQNLAGLDRRKTALSDHLHSVFAEWSRSFVGITPDFEMFFERFEILSSLAHFERNDQGDIEAAFNKQPPHNFVWMPVGRSGWNSRTRERLVEEIKTDTTEAELLKAGFAKGRQDFMDMWLNNLARISSRMRF